MTEEEWNALTPEERHWHRMGMKPPRDWVELDVSYRGAEPVPIVYAPRSARDVEALIRRKDRRPGARFVVTLKGVIWFGDVWEVLHADLTYGIPRGERLTPCPAGHILSGALWVEPGGWLVDMVQTGMGLFDHEVAWLGLCAIRSWRVATRGVEVRFGRTWAAGIPAPTLDVSHGTVPDLRIWEDRPPYEHER